MKIKYIAILILLIAAVAAVAWWASSGDELPPSGTAVCEDPATALIPTGHSQKSVRTRFVKPKSGTENVETKKSSPRGLWSTVEDDERELTKLEKSILNEIREALDSNDLRAVRKAIARFYAPKSKGGLDCRVPKELRLQALEALVWFRPETISDLVSFMADRDEEVVEDAFAKFELELDDWSIGDKERSDVLIQVMRALTDTERIDSLLFNLNNMRNSVRATTATAILSSGTSQAKAVLQDQVGFYFDSDVEDASGIKKWQLENPDEETDDDFYGPQKEDE